MRRLPPLVFPLVLALVSCISPAGQFPSSDCTGAVPEQFTRIYIGAPSPQGQQTGTSAQDPLDGTTADKFDAILRTIADGQRPTWGTQSQIPPDNLIVCMNPGVFQTRGQYDWVIPWGHTQGATNVGFTVGKNWRIHGHGAKRTILRLATVLTDQFVDNAGNPFPGGHNVVIGTHSTNDSGVEVSDLTIDANHDSLNRATGLPLDLDAIVLRSLHGHHWIHDVNIVGASGDLGVRSARYETFPVLIWGDSDDLDPLQSQGSLVEQVVLTHPGKAVVPGSFPGGTVTAIAVSNAGAEVRNNVVEGYSIAYGGFAMATAWFHDNTGINNWYGFNADSFTNIDVILESNKFIHPVHYGIVMGGSSPQQQFLRWKVLNNTVEINTPNAIGMVLQGQVQASTFARNKIFSDRPAPRNVAAIVSYSAGGGVANFANYFLENQLDSAERIDFSQDPYFDLNCRSLNRDLQDRPRSDFPDNTAVSSVPCANSGLTR